MNMVDIIIKKRDGGKLSGEEISFFVKGYTAGDIPDYQAAALNMAILLNGMDEEEITQLTMAMRDSGKKLSLKEAADFSVDKHSTGGVGDKTTLIVQPIVTACGVSVAKMSGRGLGFSGGTIDKLESIPGVRVALSDSEFLAMLKEHGTVITGQSKDLAPADGKLYALRDVTGTVPSMALITSSIMSKKLAVSTDAILLDVKVGKGAFMKTLEDARHLASLMVTIGKNCGRIMKAELSDMNQPLGYAIGNNLEVIEAIDMLKCKPTAPDLYEHCVESSANLLVMASKAKDLAEGRKKVIEALESGAAFEKLRLLISLLGGDVSYLDDTEKFEKAPVILPVSAAADGYLHEINAEEIGLASVDLGAGRIRKGDSIDHRVGIVIHHKVGDFVKAGDPLFTIHAADQKTAQDAAERVAAAHVISAEYCEKLPQFYGFVE